MNTLFHFSDDPAITLFEPRPSRHGVDLVWAVDATHAWSYQVPRECPRACFWADDDTDDADIDRFLDGDGAKIVMAIEDQWLPALELGVLHCYSLPGDTFVCSDATAGHWVSREAVWPLEVREVRDLAGQVRAAGLELRTLDSLRDLWRDVIASTLVFSGTRLRNMRDFPADGYFGPLHPRSR